MASEFAPDATAAGRGKRAGSARRGLRETLLHVYYSTKYWPFRGERRPPDDRRGLVVLQIDALAHAELRRAMELGYCPTIATMVHDEEFFLRQWFCGLPAATPYCQAGIFHGENDGIPAFRFYDRIERRVVTCNTGSGVQYIRDRISAPGALAGGSSYVNLLDGDAQTVAFTVATKERMSVYQRLGGTRMAFILLLHPIRLARMVLQAGLEWLREDLDRTLGEIAGRHTHSEGLFPFVRILTNVVVRELQTMAVLLDVYLGVPVIYTTFMQYDELGHHFGPSSRQALRDLRRTDARIREIRRMIAIAPRREYDLVILSDHGMTPAISYRVRFGETLGATVRRILEGDSGAAAAMDPVESYASSSVYAAVGPRVLETVAMVPRRKHRRWRRALRRTSAWLRSRYGLRELILPEKYYVGDAHQLVITYSSCLALLYFSESTSRLTHADVVEEPRRLHLYRALLAHAGIGLIMTLDEDGVRLASRLGEALLRGGTVSQLTGDNPLAPYGTEPPLLRAIERLARQHNSGDLIIFGHYDGYDIVSFDDQVGAHGSAGGPQVYPFIVAPPTLPLQDAVMEDARDVHRLIMSRYAAAPQ
jgi:hypothetical protein